MAYRMLGNTGLQVSVLSFGFWATYGTKDDLNDQVRAFLAQTVSVISIIVAGGH
jgi:aryl-alcohol dehydrogenase-like predicted oxidoreductase